MPLVLEGGTVGREDKVGLLMFVLVSGKGSKLGVRT